MTDFTAHAPLSSRWILDFEKQTQRRKHILLYGNIHDQFLWRGNYLTAHEFFTAYFQSLHFDLIVRYELPWNTTATATIANVFDKDPPFVASQFNYDYTNGNPLGRTYKINLRTKF